MAAPRPGRMGSTAVQSFDPRGQASRRQMSKSNAFQTKIAGGGALSTSVRRSRAGDLGGLIGGAFGGQRGEQIGTIAGEALGRLFGGGGRETTQLVGGPGTTGPCPEPLVRVGSTCVDLTALPPGGDPAFTPAPGVTVGGPGGAAVVGAFGMPGMAPALETRIVRNCGPGMVLGSDNICYPKAILRRNSRFRKWKAGPKPPISASDVKAIRKAARARDNVLELAKDVGLHASKTKPRRKK